MQICAIKPSAWTSIHEFGQTNNVPETPKENQVVKKLQDLKQGRVPSEVDAKIVFGYLKKMHNQTDFDFSEVAPELFL